MNMMKEFPLVLWMRDSMTVFDKQLLIQMARMNELRWALLYLGRKSGILWRLQMEMMNRMKGLSKG